MCVEIHELYCRACRVRIGTSETRTAQTCTPKLNGHISDPPELWAYDQHISQWMPTYTFCWECEETGKAASYESDVEKRMLKRMIPFLEEFSDWKEGDPEPVYRLRPREECVLSPEQQAENERRLAEAAADLEKEWEEEDREREEQ